MSNPHTSRPIIKTRRRPGREGTAFSPRSPGPEIYELNAALEDRTEAPNAENATNEQGGSQDFHESRQGELTRNGNDASAAKRTDELEIFPASSTLRYVSPEKHLGHLATSALIVNRVVGSGIFDLPPVLLSVVGSKGASMLTWLLGCLITWAGMTVYLEYGIRFPLTGGELYYIDFVWLKPAALVTYMYAMMFTVLSGSQGNALAFGSAVQIAASPANPTVSHGLQKLLAMFCVGFACLAQAYSRGFNVIVSNAIALYKIVLLSFIAVAGWAVLRGDQTSSAKQAYKTPYGKENFDNPFLGTSSSVFNWGIAFLLTQRSFLGYENANLILEEIRRPIGDPSRVFRQSAKMTIAMLCFLYVMVNLAFFAACSTKELHSTSDVTALFFQKVFGPSTMAVRASGILRAISAAGNVLAFSYSSVKVKQEIARLGIIPYPEFWAKSTHGGTPGPALLLHFFFSSLFILCSPLSNANGYIIISTLFTWTRTWVGALLGLGILGAWRLDSFSKSGERWKPASMPSRNSYLSWVVVMSMAFLYTAANTFIFALCWVPSNFQHDLGTKSPVLPSYAGPAIGTAISLLGAVYWVLDRHLLPSIGYRMDVEAERGEGYDVHMRFTRNVRGFPKKIVDILITSKERLGRLLARRHESDLMANEPPSHIYNTLGSTNNERIGFA